MPQSMIEPEECSLATITEGTDAPRRALVHRLVWPLFCVLVVAALLMALTVHKATRSHEQAMVAQGQGLINSLIAQEKRRIDTLSDAFAAGFAGNSWQNVSLKRLADTAGNGVSIAVLDHDGKVIADYPPLENPADWMGLPAMANKASADLEQGLRQVGDLVSLEPGITEFALLTPLPAGRMTPNADEKLRWLLVRRQITKPMMERFEMASGLGNLSAEPNMAAAAGRVSRELKAADGRVLGRISWDAPQLSNGLAADMMLWLVLALLGASLILFFANLKKAVGSVEHAYARQQAANQAKSVFLATVSHELRTPLNAILGFSEALKDGRFGVMSMRQKQYIEDIYTSGRHLNDLVDDVLDYARIESHALKLNEKPGDIGEVLRETARIMRLEASRKGLELVVDVPEVMPLMLFDAKALRQMVMNLTSNAIDFTPAGGQVTLAAWVRDDGRLSVSVEDNGPGMTDHELEVALTPFGKAASVTTGYKGHSGLGLPITRGLIELHGGSMEIDTTEGQGTSVELRFPASRRYASSPISSAETRAA